MEQPELAGGVVHDLPDDMRDALRADADARAAWEDITQLARNEWICWVTIVKTAATRRQHIARMLDELRTGKRRPCCWPGCPHRRPAATKWF
ncbi:MAG: YdeI/OmpD-associated family protein [Myxococcales bacterium]|nr:YdeI/OmpD-associated family protein [Myxococcales bacterium]